MTKKLLPLLLTCCLISLVAIGLGILFNIPATGLLLVLLVLACPIGLLLIARIVDHDLDNAFKQSSYEIDMSTEPKIEIFMRKDIVETS